MATNEFNYVEFSGLFTTLSNIIGKMGDTDYDNINAVIEDCNNKIRHDLEYAEDSDWANVMIARWEEVYPKLKNNLIDLSNLLASGKKAANEYQAFENETLRA